ncbi:unnamed protein product [Pleuronectes platessa]|uniref:Uncharacterized protein n=1 Tax=Pleuronectes platessa TaxID=8262 RepID=A0A9N7VFE3_PLEPL|nr:unnamed protein product [Pleuronectes platessa]
MKAESIRWELVTPRPGPQGEGEATPKEHTFAGQLTESTGATLLAAVCSRPHSSSSKWTACCLANADGPSVRLIHKQQFEAAPRKIWWFHARPTAAPGPIPPMTCN